MDFNHHRFQDYRIIINKANKMDLSQALGQLYDHINDFQESLDSLLLTFD